jgi:hypothetical protein
MATHDYNIANQTFPATRSDINNVLEAIVSKNSSGTAPATTYAYMWWYDTATTTLKIRNRDDDAWISFASFDQDNDTVNFLDSEVSIAGVTTSATGTVLTLSDSTVTSSVDFIIDNQKEIRFREQTGNGTNYVALKAPASLTTDTTFILPSADGTANQILKTDGSGNLSFTTLTSDGTADWDTSLKTSAFSATANKGYFLNTTSSAFTVTLPASPSAGDEIIFVDYAGTFATNNATLANNGNKINGIASPVKLETNREATRIVYIDSTQGWIAYSGVNEGSSPSLTTPSYSIDFLVVAGGASGAGGNYVGGGGGAGGFRTSTQTTFAGVTITATVGDGGASISDGAGNNGSDSSISGTGLTTITSTGGGGGGKFSGVSAKNGGSGGGGSAGVSAGLGNTPSTSPSQGNDGGGASTGTANAGSGGGGASAVGGTANNITGGNGGAGSASSITGSSITYAGGGGGSCYISGTIGTGGSGGGGNGARPSPVLNATSGTVNLGGGGGAGERSPVEASGAGGKGVVIMRMLTTDKYSGTTTGSPTVTTAGSHTQLCNLQDQGVTQDNGSVSQK